MIIDNDASNKIKENKYKILRMSLLLGQDENRQETINNFEDAARDIDKMNDDIYLKEIEKKLYDTLTLEEEEKKLTNLVDYIGGRIGQRNSLLSDFYNITGYELTSLPLIKYSDVLDEYKDRLKYIREYLNNTSEINKLNEELSDLESKLEVSYSNKEKSESLNEKNEALLLDKFKNIVNKLDDFKNIDINDLDSLLDEIREQVIESKKSLDIFNKSFNTLELSGISKEEEQEYSSYVESARDNYYKNKEIEYILTIYKLLNTNEIEYDKLLYKRDTINSLLEERLELRKELSVKDRDVLFDIYDILDKQYKLIEDEKKDLDDIDYLTGEVNSKKDRIKGLELDNQKVEILSLLKEFCIIDTYDEVENNTDNSTSDEEVDDYYYDDDFDSEIDNKEENIDSDISNDIELNSSNSDVDNNGIELNSTNSDIDTNVENTTLDNNEIKDESIDNGIDYNAFNIPNIDIPSNVVESVPASVPTSGIETNNINTSNGMDANDIYKELNIDNTSEEVNNVEEQNNNNEVNNTEPVEVTEPVEIKDNQVVNVKDVENVDIKTIVDKANTVMKRVGKMLGVEVENVDTSVSNANNVEIPNNDISIPNNGVEVPNNNINMPNSNVEVTNSWDNPDNNVVNNIETSANSDTEDVNPFISSDNNVNINNDGVIEVDKNNLFFNNNVSSNNDVDANDNNFTLNNNPLANVTFDDNVLGNNNFWDNEYDDGGLNTLPDLPVNGDVSSDNFFANNEITNFNMPNNNISNNSEVQ